MPLIQVVVIIIIVGVLLWAANTYIPMADSIRNILNIVVPLALVLWLLGLFFDWSWLGRIRVGKP